MDLGRRRSVPRRARLPGRRAATATSTSSSLVLTFDKNALVARGDLTTATTNLVLLGRRNDGKYVRGVNQVTVIP